MKPKKLGYDGEDLAAQYLKSKGYEILENNFTVRGGEIDLVARDKNTLVFVEVKTRTGNSFGYGEESVTNIKKLRIRRTIELYLSKQNYKNEPDYRVDIIGIELYPLTGKLKNISHIPDIDL